MDAILIIALVMYAAILVAVYFWGYSQGYDSFKEALTLYIKNQEKKSNVIKFRRKK